MFLFSFVSATIRRLTNARRHGKLCHNFRLPGKLGRLYLSAERPLSECARDSLLCAFAADHAGNRVTTAPIPGNVVQSRLPLPDKKKKKKKNLFEKSGGHHSYAKNVATTTHFTLRRSLPSLPPPSDVSGSGVTSGRGRWWRVPLWRIERTGIRISRRRMKFLLGLFPANGPDRPARRNMRHILLGNESSV